jgi:tRNA G18 (ribose-2'-O)-methylase SpoU
MTEHFGRNIKVEFETLSTEEVRDYSIKTSFPYVNLALNIQSNLNMGAMLRTSHLCGCRKMVIFGRRSYDKRSAVGVYNYTNVERVLGLKDHNQDLTTVLTKLDYVFDDELFYKYIIENNYIPIFVEQSEHSVKVNPTNISEIFTKIMALGKIPIFIYGNENTGIPKNIMETYSKFDTAYILELHQMGAIQSYNVSNACAIISYLVSLYFMNETNPLSKSTPLFLI